MAGTELWEALKHRLGNLALSIEAMQHPEVLTVEEMMLHIQHVKEAHSKNLFSKDKMKKGYWLVTVLQGRLI